MLNNLLSPGAGLSCRLLICKEIAPGPYGDGTNRSAQSEMLLVLMAVCFSLAVGHPCLHFGNNYCVEPPILGLVRGS
jgi:hypothetical protein